MFGGGKSVAHHNMSFYKNPCDINLKHVFLTEFGVTESGSQIAPNFIPKLNLTLISISDKSWSLTPIHH